MKIYYLSNLVNFENTLRKEFNLSVNEEQIQYSYF